MFTDWINNIPLDMRLAIAVMAIVIGLFLMRPKPKPAKPPFIDLGDHEELGRRARHAIDVQHHERFIKANKRVREMGGFPKDDGFLRD